MATNYINEYSWRSFLGIQAKNISYNDKFISWEINKKRQLIKTNNLCEDDLLFIKSIVPFSFFYFSKKDVEILEILERDGYSVSARKDPDIIIPVSNINYNGKAFRDIRWSINKISKMNIEILSDFKNFDDILKMLTIWGDTSAMKYFQDRSGKNKFFFKNNFHKDCINVFLYDKERLIGFAVLSPPDKSFNCSYIIGKSLCLIKNDDGVSYSGLSEYIDDLAYRKANELGAKTVNLGGGLKGTCAYKLKFPGAYKSDTYDGSVKLA
jgi:hypothetical protein